MILNKGISIKDDRLRNKTNEKGIMSFIRSQNLEPRVPRGLDDVDDVLRWASKLQPNVGQCLQDRSRNVWLRNYQLLQRSVSRMTAPIDRPDRQTRRGYKGKNATWQRPPIKVLSTRRQRSLFSRPRQKNVVDLVLIRESF